MNVKGRDAAALVAEARYVVARDAKLPGGVFVEFTGQFEHTVHARCTLIVVVPIVVVLIFLILYLTYHDLADAVLMMLAVPGAIAGGLFFQWLLGLKLSVTVWVGYIACFGMATSTGIIMLVYLREAIAKGGGLERMSLRELAQRCCRAQSSVCARSCSPRERSSWGWPRCSGPAVSPRRSSARWRPRSWRYPGR